MSHAAALCCLEEIAHLLLLLHESYFGGNDPYTSILTASIRFLQDIQLFGLISILDIEEAWRNSASRKNCYENHRGVSYEDFYEWLRYMGSLVFRNVCEEGRKALHLLLTQFVLPLSKDPHIRRPLPLVSKDNIIPPSNESLGVMLKYRDFLHMWFVSISYKDKQRLTPVRDLWERSHLQTSPMVNKVPFARIVMSLSTCDICPHIVHELEIRQFMETSHQYIGANVSIAVEDATSNICSSKYMDFCTFLLLLEWIATRIKLSAVQESMLGGDISVRLTILLQIISEKMLESVLLKFFLHENAEDNVRTKRRYQESYGTSERCHDFSQESRDMTRSLGDLASTFRTIPVSLLPGDVRASLTSSTSLCAASTLWLMRQAGLVQGGGADVVLIYDELIRKVDASKIGEIGVPSVQQLPVQLSAPSLPSAHALVSDRMSLSSSSSSSSAGQRSPMTFVQSRQFFPSPLSPTKKPSSTVNHSRQSSRVSDAPSPKRECLPGWSVAHLPRTLCEIADRLAGRTQSAYNRVPGVSSAGIYALHICQFTPAALFASPDRNPSLLDALYTPEAAQLCRQLLPDLEIVLRALALAMPLPQRDEREDAKRQCSQSSEPPPASPLKATTTSFHAVYDNLPSQGNDDYFEFQFATYRAFEVLCELSGVTPRVLHRSLVLKACEYVLGHSMTDRCYDRKITRGDWVEILFVIAQISFSDGNTMGTSAIIKSTVNVIPSQFLPFDQPQAPHGAGNFNVFDPCNRVADACDNFARLLRCFVDPANIPEILRRETRIQPLTEYTESLLREPSTKVLSTKGERLEAFAYAIELCEVTEAEAGQLMKETFRSNPLPSPTSSRATRDASLSTVRGGNKSLGDILVLLLHFPCNSFEYNPWILSQYFMLKPLSNIDSAVHMTMFAGAEGLDPDAWVGISDRRPRLVKILEIICKQCRVSPEVLVDYFSSFYCLNNNYSRGEVELNESQDEKPTGGTDLQEEAFGETEEKVSERSEKLDLLMMYRLQRRISMKWKIRDEISSPFFDNFVSERTLRLLHANCELLSWEFSRNSCRLRSSDPFTDGMVSPLPTATTMLSYPSDVKMTASSAIAWAQEVAGLSLEQSIKELTSTALLSGVDLFSFPSSRFVFSLTFSAFVVFAVRCFTAKVYLRKLPEGISSEMFSECIREMLLQFSGRLSLVQKSVNLPILRSMFGTAVLGPRDIVRLDPFDVIAVVRSAITLYDRLLSEPSPDSSSASFVTISKLPPRPPHALWDAARFIDFCSFCGLVDYVESVEYPLSAFVAHLQLMNNPSIQLRSGWCLSPLPIKGTPEVVLRLISMTLALASMSRQLRNNETVEINPDDINQMLARDPEGSNKSIHFFTQNVLAPVLASKLDSVKSRQPSCTEDLTLYNAFIGSADRSRIRFEDIIRFGGSRVMDSFDSFKQRLRDAYRALVLSKPCESMNHRRYWDFNDVPYMSPSEEFGPYAHYSQFLTGDDVGGEVVADGPPLLPDDVRLGSEKPQGYALEACLSVVCKYLSCGGLLRAGSIALLVKYSLHARLRPLQQSPSPTSSNVRPKSPQPLPWQAEVPVSLAEFEEMVFRSAFLAWDVVGGLDAGSSNPESLLRSYNESFDSNSSLIGQSAVVSNAIERYCNECREGAPACVNSSDVSSRGGGWGEDFLGPFLRTLFAVSVIPPPPPQQSSQTAGDASDNDDEENESNLKDRGFGGTSVGDDNRGVDGPSAFDTVEDILEARKEHRPEDLGPFGGRSYIDRHVQPKQAFVPMPRMDNLPLDCPTDIAQSVMDTLDGKVNVKVTPDASVTPQVETALISDSQTSNGGAASVAGGAFAAGVDTASLPKQPISKTVVGARELLERIKQKTGTSRVEGGVPSTDTPQVSAANLHEALSAGKKAVGSTQLLEGAREALWPVFATYCSCGDSSDPGKLSGPNLFALLSKLDVLTDNTYLSDVAILLHQVSLQTQSFSPSTSGTSQDSLALTFEEFLVFLAAFAQLRYEGTIFSFATTDSPTTSFSSFVTPHRREAAKRPELHSSDANAIAIKRQLSPSIPQESNVRRAFALCDTAKVDAPSSSGSVNTPLSSNSRLFTYLQRQMASSQSLHRLLEELILPILRRNPFLAIPEDARQRDRFSCIFSLEVLLAIEVAESTFTQFFEIITKKCVEPHKPLRSGLDTKDEAIFSPPPSSLLCESTRSSDPVGVIFAILRRLDIVPQLVEEKMIMKILADVMPTECCLPDVRGTSLLPTASIRYDIDDKSCEAGGASMRIYLPQWEWVLCVMAFEAVDAAMRRNTPNATSSQSLSSLVAEVISVIEAVLQQEILSISHKRQR